jgi:hypothetical protein
VTKMPFVPVHYYKPAAAAAAVKAWILNPKPFSSYLMNQLKTFSDFWQVH